MYRIIRGRYRLCVGDLVFYFKEPNADLIAESYDIYELTYDQAYASENYIESELENLLIQEDIWSPLHDKKLKEIQEKIEDLKVEAYKNFLNIKMLNHIKRKISILDSEIMDLLREKHKLDHTSCHGVAENARLRWLISKCVDVEAVDSQKLLEAFQQSSITSHEIRQVAKSIEWRSIWTAAEYGNLFNRNVCDFSSEQLSLISYSRMYDNVYEHPEKPNDKIIEDDICLDGWFIHQKKEIEKEKTKRETDSMIKSPKIRNADEVFVMANSNEEAERIYDLNSIWGKQAIKNRSSVVNEKGRAKQGDFADIKQEMEIKSTNLLRQHLKGR